MERRAEEAAALARRQGEPPERGDLFLAPRTRAFAVEWLVLERRGGRLLVIPADTQPLAGTGDVRLSARAPSGPLTLRCRHAAWVEERALAGAARSGRLAAGDVDRARARQAAAEAGEVDGEVLEQEVDLDPEYQDWIAEVVAPAREALAAAGEEPRGEVGAGEREGPAQTAGPPWPLALAATFFIAAVGLSVWVVALREDVDRLSEPEVGLPPEAAFFGATSRGVEVIAVPPGATKVPLAVVLDQGTEPFAAYRLEILDAEGEVVWRSAPLPGPAPREFSLSVPRRFAADGYLRLRLSGLDGGASKVLEEVTLRVTERPI
jgi:hypothetical protein